MSDLRVDWCSYDAAKFAVENWHYSEQMPSGSTVKLGVWEDGDFTGTIIFNRGASPWLANPYDGIRSNEVCELARIALNDHENPVSQSLSYAIKLLKQNSPDLRLAISFADPKHGHDGTVYQASNWIYVGRAPSNTDICIGSEKYHERTVGNKYGTTRIEVLKQKTNARPIKRVSRPDKYKYVYPLDDSLRPKLQEIAKPYP